MAAWHINLGVDMRRFKEMGLDAVVTDHPDVLLAQWSTGSGEE